MTGDDLLVRERQAWTSVAPAWSAWWRVFEAAARDLNERLVAAAAVEPGHLVLDVATGLGEPALTAARAAGSRGRVLGVDLSRGMLEHAVARAGGDAHGNVVFVEADACALPLAERVFDSAVSRWGLMLVGDPFSAARAVARALRLGARFAAAVWCEPERVPFLSLARAVVSEALDLPAPDPDEPGPFRLAAPGALEDVFASAGYTDVAGEEVPVAFRFPDGESYARFALELSSSLRKAVASLDESGRAGLRSRLAEAAERAHGEDDEIVFRCVSRLVSGRADA